MWAQNNLWACMGIFVSGLMKLRPENLFLNNLKSLILLLLLLPLLFFFFFGFCFCFCFCFNCKLNGQFPFCCCFYEFVYVQVNIYIYIYIFNNYIYQCLIYIYVNTQGYSSYEHKSFPQLPIQLLWVYNVYYFNCMLCIP